ncbi:MAG TPA: aldehyde dehydrogenase family protein, partial [Thiolinea sp.]|nr:aldehyde dehydrogenase family protein [Thiolinea sp.]
MSNPLLQRSLSLYSNGVFTEGAGETLVVYDPATRSELANLQAANATQVEQAITAANHAFTAWRDLGGCQRAVYLRHIAEGLEQRREQLIDVQMR